MGYIQDKATKEREREIVVEIGEKERGRERVEVISNI
jgi:hypothetical protein